MFTEQFSERDARPGETILCVVDGFDCVATIYLDEHHEAPWEWTTVCGPVSNWTTRDKRPGEFILATDRQHKRYYDFQEACRIARADKWDAPPYKQGTRRQQAARAAYADFEHLRRWCADQWRYVGVAVTVSKNGIDLTDRFAHALWGIESDSGEYLTETANDLLAGALTDARAAIAALRGGAC
jgi:hypothetical protein